MAGLPGYQKKVKEGSNDVPASSASLEHNGEILDDTEMATNNGYRSRLLGIREVSMALTCVYNSSNTSLTNILAAWTNGTTVTMHYLPDGTNGFQGTFVVESFNLSGDVGGMEEVEVQLRAIGALSASP